MSENKMVGGYHLGYLLNNPVLSAQLLNDINVLLEMYKQGKIKIKIDSTYSFSKVGEAMKRLHSRQNIGKVLLKPDYEFHPPVSSDQIKIVTTVITTTTSTSSIEATKEEPNKPTEKEDKNNAAWKTSHQPIKMDEEEKKVPITVEQVTHEAQIENGESESIPKSQN
jgi:hypothetical protein